MAYSEKQYRSRVSFAQANNALIMLLAINLVIFVALMFFKAVYHLQAANEAEALAKFNNRILTYFSLSPDLGELGSKPWTVLTYMFTHAQVWHILGNMLWLWVFGYILQDLTGNRKIVPIYLYGALVGAGAFILIANISPAMGTTPMIGASAGVMAVAVATTTIAPGFRIFPMLGGGIPLWIITVVYLIIDLASIPGENTGGHIAHLAGALTGFLYILSYRRGYDWGEWMNRFYDWFMNLFNPDKPKKLVAIKQELYYQATTPPFKKTPNLTEQRVDEILDKISQKGLGSLTDEERDLLKRASE